MTTALELATKIYEAAYAGIDRGPWDDQVAQDRDLAILLRAVNKAEGTARKKAGTFWTTHPSRGPQRERDFTPGETTAILDELKDMATASDLSKTVKSNARNKGLTGVVLSTVEETLIS